MHERWGQGAKKAGGKQFHKMLSLQYMNTLYVYF
jgi:hypothetical protein